MTAPFGVGQLRPKESVQRGLQKALCDLAEVEGHCFKTPSISCNVPNLKGGTSLMSSSFTVTVSIRLFQVMLAQCPVVSVSAMILQEVKPPIKALIQRLATETCKSNVKALPFPSWAAVKLLKIILN